jgi:hypothetical protein
VVHAGAMEEICVGRSRLQSCDGHPVSFSSCRRDCENERTKAFEAP